MKILIAITGIPPFCGGAEQVAWETAVRLSKYKDFEIHILTLGNNPLEVKENIKIHYIPRKPLGTIYYSTIGLGMINSLLSKEKFDIIHSHMVLPFGFIFRNYKGIKIITCHGSDVYKTKFYEFLFTRMALRKSDFVTTVSEYFKNFIEKKWKVKSLVIPNGVDLTNFFPRNFDRKPNSILFVGRFNQNKGIKQLLKAAKELKDYEFYFVGKGKLDYLIKGKNIFNLGFKNHSELPLIYSSYEISVFPSDFESFGLVALESMACGTPVIVTPIGFSDFVTNNNGIIISSNDYLTIKKTILNTFLNKSKLNILSKSGIETSRKFSWENVIQEYYNLYQLKYK